MRLKTIWTKTRNDIEKSCNVWYHLAIHVTARKGSKYKIKQQKMRLQQLTLANTQLAQSLYFQSSDGIYHYSPVPTSICTPLTKYTPLSLGRKPPIKTHTTRSHLKIHNLEKK